MIRYFEKTTSNSIEHFKITVTQTGLSVSEGKIYKTLSNWSRGYSSFENALEQATKLIQEKQSEGYQEKEYKETLENSFSTYDKAKWHYESDDFPEELDYSQGFVHTGMFLWWLIENELMSEEFIKDSEEDMRQCQNRQITGTEVFKRRVGVLSLEDVNEEGNVFGIHYYNQQYLEDYAQIFCEDLPTAYHVEDSIENYLKLKRVIDKRYRDWKQKKE